jgi:hypothetical protein
MSRRDDLYTDLHRLLDEYDLGWTADAIMDELESAVDPELAPFLHEDDDDEEEEE